MIKITHITGGDARGGFSKLNATQERTVARRIKQLLKKMNVRAKVR